MGEDGVDTYSDGISSLLSLQLSLSQDSRLRSCPLLSVDCFTVFISVTEIPVLLARVRLQQLIHFWDRPLSNVNELTQLLISCRMT